jgi:hypothetical protein
MEETFAAVESLRQAPMARARQVCRLAALLHDTGHCCFSHAAEEVIHNESDHESLTVKILLGKEFLQETIDSLFFPGCSQLTASLIKRQPNSPPQLQILRDIVSGQVDADRSDYLLRDSLHCGVDCNSKVVVLLKCAGSADAIQLRHSPLWSILSIHLGLPANSSSISRRWQRQANFGAQFSKNVGSHSIQGYNNGFDVCMA